MANKRHTINALINLLEDEDRHVSTVAMEQLLMLDQNVDELVAEFQESHSPVLRSRIHQLGNILKMRRSRSLFIENVKTSSITQWQGIKQINYQYNPAMNAQEVERIFSALVERLPEQLSPIGLAEFMRNENFSFTAEDMMGADLYLIEDVLIQRMGAPILLSIIAQELAIKRRLKTSITIFKGKHCLIDSTSRLIEPSEDWRVTCLTTGEKLHSCNKDDTWLTVLGQLFLSAILEGRLQAIYRVGAILSELCGGKLRNLPFPLGTEKQTAQSSTL
jgi:hypothetical protein